LRRSVRPQNVFWGKSVRFMMRGSSCVLRYTSAVAVEAVFREACSHPFDNLHDAMFLVLIIKITCGRLSCFTQYATRNAFFVQSR